MCQDSSLAWYCWAFQWVEGGHVENYLEYDCQEWRGPREWDMMKWMSDVEKKRP